MKQTPSCWVESRNIKTGWDQLEEFRYLYKSSHFGLDQMGIQFTCSSKTVLSECPLDEIQCLIQRGLISNALVGI